jgi:NTP pyrophosphatase (non-canonical NTP hydrolase)
MAINKNSTLIEYQIEASKTNCYPQTLTGTLAIALALAEEAGEVAGKFSKMIRDDDDYFSKDRIAQIRSELGDVLWQTSQLAAAMGWTLDEIAAHNIEKLEGRVKRNTIHGSGDNR